MSTRTLTLTALLVLLPFSSLAADVIGDVDKALGGASLSSIEFTGHGTSYAVGQSAVPGQPWPRFELKSATRTINYDTASARDELVRTQGENPPRGGGLQPIRGELRQTLAVSGDHAFNVAGGAPAPAPVALAERQMQLWITPHGLVKAARKHNASIEGRAFAFEAPGRFRARATVDANNLIERVDARVAFPVVGDMPVEVIYADYRDFGGVKFPTKIRQTIGGFPALDMTVTDVKPNAPADITAPDAIRQTTNPYGRVATQMVADGVWYLTGGSHNSVAIEMKDHVIVVEGPLNDERAAAVIAEVKTLVPSKPIKYVVNTHHHFDHAGGLRAFAAEGATILTHAVNQPYYERVLATRATISPDLLAKSGRGVTVEGVRDRRVLTDGARTVELLHIAGNAHDDGLLMAYLPKEKLLIEADVFTPPAQGTPPAMPPSPFTVQFSDTVARLGLAVDQILPLHGRIVPFADLGRAVGRTP